MKSALILALSMLGSQQGRVLCETLWDYYITEFSITDEEHAELYAGNSTDRYEDLKSFAKELGWTVKWSNWELSVDNGTDMFICDKGEPVEQWTIVK
jgi:hypothetical protein